MHFFRNNWKNSALLSNVLWIKYLCIKIQEAVYSEPNGPIHIQCLKSVEKIQKLLPKCKSAVDILERLHIIDNVPEQNKNASYKLRQTTKFYDRNSNQKSYSRKAV